MKDERVREEEEERERESEREKERTRERKGERESARAREREREERNTNRWRDFSKVSSIVLFCSELSSKLTCENVTKGGKNWLRISQKSARSLFLQ